MGDGEGRPGRRDDGPDEPAARDHRRRRAALSAAALVLLLVFAVLVARIPHTIDLYGEGGHDFPLHLDEYVHWGRAAAVARQGTTGFADPWSGGADYPIGAVRGAPPGELYHEVGFHVVLAAIQLATGLDWVVLFAWGPAAVTALIALAAYVVGRRGGFGHEAALFAALIPTSATFLGPALLVPIAFALPLLLAGVWAMARARGAGDVAALAALVAFLWLVHVRVGAFLLVPAVAAAVLHAHRRRPGVAAGVLAVAVAPAAVAAIAAPGFVDLALRQTAEAPFLIADPSIFLGFGWATMGLFAAGAGRVVLDADRPPEAVLAAATALVALVPIVGRLAVDVDLAGMYGRAHMVLFATAAPVAGYALAGLLGSAGPALAGLPARLRSRVGAAGRAAAVLLVLLAVVPALAAHQDPGNYYRTPVMTAEDHEVWTWMDANLARSQGPVLMVPWKALAFGAMTGRAVVDPQFPGQPVRADDPGIAFLLGDGDPEILRRHDVEIVYSEAPLDHPELVLVREGVYLVATPA